MSQSDWDPEPAELREGETPDETSHAARNAAMLANAGALPELHIGDHVDDREADGSATMLVASLPLAVAENYEIGDGTTVADVNPDYPDIDDVVGVTFPQRTDVDVSSRDKYAFPRSRLRLEAPIHDRDGDEEVSE